MIQPAAYAHVKEHIQAFQVDVDSWKGDHAAAMQCLDLEILLRQSLFVFETINLIDEHLRAQGRSGEFEFTAHTDAELTALYETWLQPCNEVLAALSAFESQGFTLEHAEAFRTAVGEARGILTPDDQFFTGNRLRNLRDAAIQEFRNGECESLTED